MRHARPDYNRIQDPEGLIPEDEPVMLFRGQDVYAVNALRAYAKSIQQDIYATPEAIEVSKAVFDWAEEMRQWGVKKFPDLK